MRILHVDDRPLHVLDYLCAAPGGGRSFVQQLPLLTATVSGLPDRIDGLILTSDLQGRELLASTDCNDARSPILQEGRLLGEQVAEELTRVLEANPALPRPDSVGVLLAGDFWSEPGTILRGGLGDVAPVWRAFAKHFRWVAGVHGNHDILTRAGAGMYLLDGQAVTVDGCRLAGVGGIIGNSSKPNRKSDATYLRLLQFVLEQRPDMLITHESPEGPAPGDRGKREISECLQRYEPTLHVCGHCHWNWPFAELSNGTQVCNVDGRVVLLTRAP